MKKIIKFLLTILCVSILALPVIFGACEETAGNDDPGNEPGETETPIETVDYADQLKLNMNSETKKQEVKVKLFIDGDTTHFDPVSNASEFASTDGYIKARYLAINTPESTGKIEKWGKSASNFTHDKLENAKSIIVESDDDKWNIDSTGERYLLWVWYIPEDGTEYRNLNIEILQNGFALASSISNNRYGEIATKALDQAKAQQLHLYSPASTVDPNYYDGDIINITLKELRCHITDYLQTDVRVEGVVTAKYNDSVYIEEKDEETGLYFGMAVYYGKQASGTVVEVLSIGNRVRVVGSVTEFQGTYQISGVSSNEFRPGPTDSTVISKGNEAAFAETSAKDIVSGKVSVNFESENDEGEIVIEKIDLDYGEAIMSTSVTVSNLRVVSVYTTSSGSSKGAMSITCEAADGTKIVIRTEILTENGVIVTADKYEGKVITVKGLIDKYNGSYQVAVHRVDYITIVG